MGRIDRGEHAGQHRLGSGEPQSAVLHNQRRRDLECGRPFPAFPVGRVSAATWYNNDRDVTADRVLANTFYMVFDGHGLFKTTNGGVTWTQVYAATSDIGLFY